MIPLEIPTKRMKAKMWLKRVCLKVSQCLLNTLSKLRVLSVKSLELAFGSTTYCELVRHSSSSSSSSMSSSAVTKR
jgi:hypothetical protein